MPRDREQRDIYSKSKVQALEDYLEKVSCDGDYNYMTDKTPFLTYVERHYETRSGKTRFDFINTFIESLNKINIKKNMVTEHYEALPREEQGIVEDIAHELLNYTNSRNLTTLNTMVMRSTYLKALKSFMSKKDDYYTEPDYRKAVDGDDIVEILSKLGGISSLDGIKGDFDIKAMDSVVELMAEGNNEQRDAVLKLISIANFGLEAALILNKLSSAAAQMNPDAVDEEDRSDKSTKAGKYREYDDSLSSKERQKLEDDILNEIEDDDEDGALNIKKFKRVLEDVDDEALQDIYDIVNNNGITPSDIESMNEAARLLWSYDPKNSVVGETTYLSIAYALFNAADKKDKYSDIQDQFADIVDARDKDFLDNILWDMRAALDFDLRNETNFVAYSFASTSKTSSKKEAKYIKELMGSRNPQFTLEKFEDYLKENKLGRKNVTVKDVENFVSDLNISTYDVDVMNAVNEELASAVHDVL